MCMRAVLKENNSLSLSLSLSLLIPFKKGKQLIKKVSLFPKKGDKCFRVRDVSLGSLSVSLEGINKFSGNVTVKMVLPSF